MLFEQYFDTPNACALTRRYHKLPDWSQTALMYTFDEERATRQENRRRNDDHLRATCTREEYVRRLKEEYPPAAISGISLADTISGILSAYTHDDEDSYIDLEIIRTLERMRHRANTTPPYPPHLRLSPDDISGQCFLIDN